MLLFLSSDAPFPRARRPSDDAQLDLRSPDDGVHAVVRSAILAQRVPGRGVGRRRPRVEALGSRTLLAVSVLNNSGNGLDALGFNQSGGYVPPDTCGAAGPSAYVETVNQEVALYASKATGASTDSLSHFLFTTGGLTRADSGSGLSDPIVAYDEKIGRFIIGDQDVNSSTHVIAFELAVSKSSNPATLSAADWTFYKITTTQTGEDADYPGNFGYNADAFVFTLNMFAVAGTSGTSHVQVVSGNAADLAAASASPAVFRNNLADFSVRPTTMHDAAPGDPMWLVTEHGDNLSIDVYKMTNVLTTSAGFARTNLAVTPYSQAVAPKNPNGTSITTNTDSRIDKAAEAGGILVTAHTVSASPTQDVVQWYAFDVAGGTPTLSQQGRVSAGSNTYLMYPGIDISPSGAIGISYIRSGTDTSTDYMSMYVTGRVPSDAAGTMETPVRVPVGAGLANYTDFANPHREGDLSGINVDPVDGSFWAVNEFANTQATANWGTAVANFLPSTPANSADLASTTTGPSAVTAGTIATYTVTIRNNGPSAATGVVLTDTLPPGSVYQSAAQTGGADAFTLSQSGGTVAATAAAGLGPGASDTFTIVVSAPSSLSPGSTFSNTASVAGSTSDPNTANNSATASGSIVGPAADLAVAASGPASATEGGQLTYTVTVTNGDAANAGTGVVLTDTLGANLKFVSAAAPQGTFSQSNRVVTFTLGTIAPGATVTVTVVAQAIEDGSLTNSASVTASSADPNSANNGASATTSVAEASIVVSGSPTSATQKNISGLTTATSTHAGGIEPASAFAATINWGDGTTSTGTISQSGATYSVVGSHRYRTSGSHAITTTVTEVGSSARLLLLKVGDEVPDLPDQYGGKGDHDHPTPRGRANGFAGLVDAYVGQQGGVTLADVRSGLIALLDAADRGGFDPPLSTLFGNLHARSARNSRVVDALLLIDDLVAARGI